MIDEKQFSFFASAAKGLESLLFDELDELGISTKKVTPSGVNFDGSLEQGYQVLMWSRIASRLIVQLYHEQAEHINELYEKLVNIQWEHIFENDCTFAVQFSGKLKGINNTLFAAQRAKDAVVDRFEKAGLLRPNVDTVSPDCRIVIHCYKGKATIGIDLSGEGLHKRGYRKSQGEAPLKETLAAAILRRAGWTKSGKLVDLIDPMCGSGTFLIEAAMIKADIAPGLLHVHWGFEGWLGHHEQTWEGIVAQAYSRREQGIAASKSHFYIEGVELDQQTYHSAQKNIEAIGLTEYINLYQGDCLTHTFKPQSESGVIVSNPPFGERIGEKNALAELYEQWGRRLLSDFVGWEFAWLSYDDSLTKHIPFRWHHKYKLFNGPLECTLYCYHINQENFHLRFDPYHVPSNWEERLDENAVMLKNRLKKNAKQLSKWLKKNEIECYRWYDADLPEYSAAIDIYRDAMHIQEYQAPKSVDEKIASRRMDDIIHVAMGLTGIPKECVAVKRRVKQAGKNQYEKIEERKEFATVQEAGLKFRVNLYDYLDTGLFLDHRQTRLMIKEMSKGVRFLNLFAYTGSGSVYAASGGAKTTTTVDMSKTYLAWAQKNMALNGFNGASHMFVNEDCFAWLEACRQSYDLIFMDPPTFSNSKKMSNTLDIQRDHVLLINSAMLRLSPQGKLVFSTNFRRFHLDDGLLERYRVRNITHQTLPKDFARRKNFHQVYIIEKRENKEIWK